MFRGVAINRSRKSLWALGNRFISGASEGKDTLGNEDNDEVSSRDKSLPAGIVSTLNKRDEEVSESDSDFKGKATNDKKFFDFYFRSHERKEKIVHHQVHSSKIGKAIGLFSDDRVSLWLELIGKPPSSIFLPFWEYKKVFKALERYRRLFPNQMVKPIILEESFFAHPRDDNIYKIDSENILQIRCRPGLREPYKEVTWEDILQAQALMALSDADFLELFCWTEQGSSLFRIQRNSFLWWMISAAVGEFWENHVKPGRERFKSHMKPIAELADILPSNRHQDFDDIQLESVQAAKDSVRLLYEVSPIYLTLCESQNYFPSSSLEMESYRRFESPIARRFKTRVMNLGDFIYLGLTMYDHQHKSIPISLDDTLLSYMIQCKSLSREDKRFSGASVWSSISRELLTEAIYHALLREVVKHSENPSFSCILRSLKMKAAARIKSGEYSDDMFLLWTKTVIKRKHNSGSENLESFLDFPYGADMADILSHDRVAYDYPVQSLGISQG